MTENEAIKELETSIYLAKMCTQNCERKREIQGYEMAINALEEIQQYRAIGTPEECRVAVEKQNADGCSGCVFELVEEWEMPCTKCKRHCKDYWRARRRKVE